MENKSFVIIVTAIICSFLLHGCSHSSGSPNQPPKTSMPELHTSATEALTFTYAESNGAVYTTNGYYDTQFIFAGAANIFYTDYATKERIFLCARPECNHDNDTCQSYISYSGTFPPKLLHVGDTLFAVLAPTDNEPQSVISMNMDASNKQELFHLEANQLAGGTFITDNKYLYFMVNEVSPEGNTTDKLMRADILTGEVSIVYQFESDAQSITLMGYAGNKLGLTIISANFEEAPKYVLCDPNNPTLDEIEYKYDASVDMIYEDCIYSVDNVAQVITKQSITTGEITTVHIPMKDGYGDADVRITFDGNLLLSEYSHTDNDELSVSTFLVDMEKCTCSDEISLNKTYNNRPITPLASYGDYLFVLIDFEEYTAPRMDAKGVISEQAFVANKYALILREDYENSIPNYIPIQDSSIS